MYSVHRSVHVVWQIFSVHIVWQILSAFIPYKYQVCCLVIQISSEVKVLEILIMVKQTLSVV